MTAMNPTTYECPLCSLDFEGAVCHSSCPMAKGCRMVRCPRCGYEFVQESTLVDLIRLVFSMRRLPGREA
jgi:hypothetical protein